MLGACLLLAPAGSASAQDQDLNDPRVPWASELFEEGLQLLEQDQPAEALARFRQIVDEMPTPYGSLWYGGSAAIAIDDRQTAIDYSERLLSYSERPWPSDWYIHIRLVPLYHQVGDFAARDRARDAAVAAWEASDDPEVRDRTVFVIETVNVEGTRVRALQRVCLCGEVAKRYVFTIEPAQGASWFITLGSYETTSDYARERQGRPAEWRIWHLDGYAPGIHYTFTFFDQEPDYDTVAAIMRQIVASGDPASLATSSSTMTDAQSEYFMQ